MVIPLRRLPWLATKVVVQMMDPVELLSLSQSSKVLRHCVLLATRRFEIHVTLCANDIQHGLLIEYVSDETRYGAIFNLQQSIAQTINHLCHCKDTVIPMCVAFKSGLMVTYWDSIFDGFQMLMRVLLDRFKVKTVSFDLEKQPEYKIRKIFGVASSLWIPYRKFRFAGLIPEKAAQWFFYQESKFEKLELCAFKLTRLQLSNISINDLRIEQASWVTVDNLEELMNCKRCVLIGVNKIRESDLREILIGWVMEPTRIEYLGIEFEGTVVDQDQVVRGLPVDYVQSTDPHTTIYRLEGPAEMSAHLKFQGKGFLFERIL